MTPAQIQRQLSVNRKILADMYYQLEAARSWRAFWSDPVRIGDIASEEDCKNGAYNFHKESVKLVPKIAAIVELQKSLKKSYQQALSMQRAERLVANGWLKGHLEAAKRDAEEKGKAARDMGMSMSGEMY